ncbi:hypothetical protein [Leucobacter sp. wl10]|uniref:hypothetical protein n=1 Tax=Leucobacter sp. wl10 TaxID=2304677 RepID=UPI000E5A9F4B|nr:hypothetical protein [Leucobacter sp. wl10]RGE19074.1 hypothetical protein D1J51_13205 [Leucobacter sp. wl10]
MGMDVYGKAPTTDAGEYFRNNVWWWHPLADFLLTTYPDLTEACTYWHSNDGDGLDAATSLALAEAIERDLASGKVAEYARRYEAEVGALPDEECTICRGAGIRTDAIGQEYGYDQPRDPDTGKGGCNGCSGTGRTPAWETHYPFDAENVKGFAAFLRGCGGFEIC